MSFLFLQEVRLSTRWNAVSQQRLDRNCDLRNIYNEEFDFFFPETLGTE